ncbi:MAG: histidyl-tRNA synthetase [Rickettsiales bacterium]|jgi:histidyl-tRNA synthetase
MKNQINKDKMQPVRGTKDLFGQEILAFNHIVNTTKSVAETYGFSEISTPIFEFSEIFERNLGETSDIISKEVYKFPDRGDNFLTLRPEFTAGIVRALISNGELSQSMPQKLFSSGPIFRYDRPQKGRQRQFHQINFESIGQKHFLNDAEMIGLACLVLKKLGVLKHTTLQVNSLGSEETKFRYKNALIEYFSKYRQELSEDSQSRLEKNPLRILDSKNANDIKISSGAPFIKEYFDDDSWYHFEHTLISLTTLGISYRINPMLVRGLDYYTGTVFEFTTGDLGAQNAVLAGGRYDNLMSKMGGQDLPAIGFAAGIERLMLLSDFKSESPRPVFVVYVSTDEQKEAFRIVSNLRNAGIYSEMLFDANIKKQMKKASELNTKFAIIIGEEEAKSRIFKIKNFDTGIEDPVMNKHILRFLKQNN